MMVSLPDLNVLIALAWPTHVHHRQARRWFDACSEEGWATCPFTQSGFIRISSNPRIVDLAVAPRDALVMLRRLTALGRHTFWPADIDLAATPFAHPELVVGHRQVTDACLLQLAIQHAGRLVTLDQSLPALLPENSPLRAVVQVISVEPT